MRLTKLEIYGFKSFAKRTEIIFPQNVTGIVGPNGSGKSNIGDAVRWVLGEQSAKSLRGNSMADVIFNGTERKKPMNYCEVTLSFDNSDQQLSLPYDEVSVTRRVYRSGDSEYQLNGSNCRLKDIVDLFRDTGIGKEGYSIIGQGRIDNILSQHSEDRRAVFEEAAGISRYRTRKDEAQSRMKRADENLIRVMDVLEELETHLAPLEKQAKTAKEYLSLSDSLRELDVNLFLHRHDQKHQRQKIANENLTLAQVELENATAELDAHTKERTAGEEELMTLQHAVSQAHNQLLEKNNVLHEAKEQASHIAHRLQTFDQETERLAKQEKSIANRQSLIAITMEHSDEGTKEAKAHLQRATDALEERKLLYEQKNANADTLEQQLTEHKEIIMQRMNQLQTLRTTQARQSAMQQQMEKRRQEVIESLQNEAVNEEGFTKALLQAEASLASEQERFETLQTTVSTLDQTTKTLLQDLLQKQKTLQENQQTQRATDTRLRTLKEFKDGFEGYQYAVKNALTYAKHQQLQGVHGVLAMLLNVPKEYETAMDMVLGGALQNIITQTEHDAKTLIEYLRKNRLGRATFLPLATIRGRTLNAHERHVLTMKGCVGVASELCTYDPKYRNVVENLLGRTIVAENLEYGIEIMRAGGQGFRLVTLQGDVMHSGGSMTGGSVQQKAQNLLGREREIKELAQTLQTLNVAIAEDQQEMVALETARTHAKDEREEAQYALHQQEIAVVRDGERLKNATADLQAHKGRMEALQTARDQLTESLQDIADELARIEKNSDQEAFDTDAMNQTTNALSASLNVARREKETAREAHTDAMLTLQNAQHDLDRITRDHERLESDYQQCQTDLADIARLQQENQDSHHQAIEAQKEANVAIDQHLQAIELQKQTVTDTELARDHIQLQLQDLQSDIDHAGQVVAIKTESVHKIEFSLSRIKSEITQLTDRLWDTYELTYAGAMEAKEAYDAIKTDPPPFEEEESDRLAQSIRDRIRRMGTVNVGAIEEYAQMHERFTEINDQKMDLEHAKNDLQTLITQLLHQMETTFVAQFGLMQEYFSETFSRLFGGGHGEISLSDPKDPLHCGIDIIVQPPGKKRQLLSLFSGGERALTAIAILFAMLKVKPSPFCILDEIEAALDEANVSYFADYLKEFSHVTQFVVVTHRKGTMERCDTLFGVAMEERGVSSMVSVNLADYQ